MLLDLGTGVAGPLARFAIERADQVVLVTTPEWVTATVVLEALSHLAARPHHGGAEQVTAARRGRARSIEQRFRAQHLHRSVTIPYDEQLATMLDCGTYTLDALERGPRASRSSSSGSPSQSNSSERERIEVFFKMLSAMVAADALNRRQREQQHRRWLDEQRFAAAPWAVRPPLPVQPTRAPASDAVDWSAPERPR